MTYKHLFGPVQSRRLGTSLGVDMIPLKTCNCNCVYCECGGAKTVSNERKPFIPAAEIITELDHYLGSGPPLDYVTFAGSGEPTLNSELGKVLRFVKTRYSGYATALLTNGVLLYQPELQEELLAFDLILPSLDAVSEEVFNRVNRPFPGVAPQQMIDGLISFSQRFTGTIWVEVFIVPGINDTPEELAAFKQVLQQIRLSRIQLNSLDRPGACNWVTVATPEQLSAIAAFLAPLPVEIIARNAPAYFASQQPRGNSRETILSALRRRPSTVEELAILCTITINETACLLDALVINSEITRATLNGRTFYSAL